MKESNANWILRNGSQTMDCTSFPYAFRTMFNIVRKSIENKKPVNTRDLSILGPRNLRGERTTYSYEAASQLASEQGLLTVDGQINSREFKRR
jgi:hypothetical protein